MLNRPLQIGIKDSVFDPNLPPSAPRKVHVRSSGTNSLYKVWLYLTGADLPYVKQVTYRLHPSFPEPIRTIARTVTNPTCELVLWTWGVFPITAIVEDKQGNQYELSHKMRYDKELPKERTDYIFETEPPPESPRTELNT